MLNAYTFWLYLPAYVCAVIAITCRRVGLTIVSVLVVLCHLAWVVPTLRREQSVPAVAAHAPHVRVVTANIRYDNDRADVLADQLGRLDADVMLLQEVTPQWWDTLVEHGVVDRYPGRARALRTDAGGEVILSRWPLHNVRRVDAGIWPVQTADVTIAGTEVHLVNLHPVPPFQSFSANQEMLRTIFPLLRRTLRTGEPTIAAGDLNATQFNRVLHQLQGLGLRSLHEATGRPWATTWPNGHHKVPPIRLDHVLYNKRVVGLRAREGDGAGSDHRPVIGEVAILNATR
jgi:endonuclease/exonuclease/phosphatase (EEP) superfamily protein YafD